MNESNESNEENYKKRLEQKEIFDKLVNERMNEVKSLSNQISYKNLTYYLTNKILPK